MPRQRRGIKPCVKRGVNVKRCRRDCYSGAGQSPAPTHFNHQSVHYSFSRKKKHRSIERCFFVLALPIFPGASARQVSSAEISLTDLSRDDAGGVPNTHTQDRLTRKTNFHAKRNTALLSGVSSCWRYLSSRAVSSQVLSAEASLTSVFGMGTGGPSP